MAGTEMDIAAVRAATTAARQALGAFPQVSTFEDKINEGGRLLRHEGASPALDTAAERLQELIDELRALTGDVIDALESAAAVTASVESDSTDTFTVRAV